MFDVDVTESPDKYSIAVESNLSLETGHLAAACGAASGAPVINAEDEADEPTRYNIDLPKSAWRWGRESLKEEVLDRLFGLASHKFVWEVDGSPFPNKASEVLWQMMRRGTEGAVQELRGIRAEWIQNVRSDEELRGRTVVHWLNEREFETRLKDRVGRRLLLIGWIDTFLSDGLEDAHRYATKNYLVRA